MVDHALSGGRSVSGGDTLYSFDRNDPRPAGQCLSSSALTFMPIHTSSAGDRRRARRATSAPRHRRQCDVGRTLRDDGMSDHDSRRPPRKRHTARVRWISRSASPAGCISNCRFATSRPMHATPCCRRSDRPTRSSVYHGCFVRISRSVLKDTGARSAICRCGTIERPG